MSESKRQPKPKPARSEEERREKMQAILAAAIEVFSAKGYAATRLDDVARRAGVGKGTLYLYVSSKQDLFEAMIRNSFASPFDLMETAVQSSNLSVEETLRLLIRWFIREVLSTSRREMIWLIFREARQFPEIARFHHKEVVSRGLRLLRQCAERGVASGELRTDELVRFPQLVVAPAILSIIWMSLFQDIDPLDVEAMLDAQIDLLLRASKGNTP